MREPTNYADDWEAEAEIWRWDARLAAARGHVENLLTRNTARVTIAGEGAGTDGATDGQETASEAAETPADER